MKKNIVFIASALAALCSCTEVLLPDNSDTIIPAHQIKVRTSSDETKTAINYSGTGSATFNWTAGDRIHLNEFIHTSSQDTPFYNYAYSEILEKDSKAAEFTVNVGDYSTPSGDIEEVEYFATFPHAGIVRYGNPLGGEDIPDHPVVLMNISSSQIIRENSFDPNADVLVSNVVKGDYDAGKPVELNLRFARLGSIACLRLHGLGANEELVGGYVNFEASDETKTFNCCGARIVGYDTYTNTTFIPTEEQFPGNGAQLLSAIAFEAGISQGKCMHADANGDMTVYLRLASGEAYNMSIGLYNMSATSLDDYAYSKKIDIEGIMGKPLLFKEGGMTVLDINF